MITPHSPDCNGSSILVTPDTQKELFAVMQTHTGNKVLENAELLFPPIKEQDEGEPLAPLPLINAPIEATVDGVAFDGWAYWAQEGTSDMPTVRLAASITRSDKPGTIHDFEFHTIPDGLGLEKYERLPPVLRGTESTTSATAPGQALEPMDVYKDYVKRAHAARFLARSLGLAMPEEEETQQLIKAIRQSGNFSN